MQIVFNPDSDFDNETIAQFLAPATAGGWKVDVALTDGTTVGIKLDAANGFGLHGLALDGNDEVKFHGTGGEERTRVEWADVETVTVF